MPSSIGTVSSADVSLTIVAVIGGGSVVSGWVGSGASVETSRDKIPHGDALRALMGSVFFVGLRGTFSLIWQDTRSRIERVSIGNSKSV